MKITAEFTIDPKTSDPAKVAASFEQYLRDSLYVGVQDSDDPFTVDAVHTLPPNESEATFELPDDQMVVVKVTDEGVICDLYVNGDNVGTRGEMASEIAEALAPNPEA